jgi:phosphatidate cytidylyltransferase
VNNLTTRSITAVFFVIAMVGSILLGQTVAFVLFFITVLLSLSEYITLVSNDNIQPAYWPTLITGGLVYSIFSLNAMGILKIEWLFLIIPFIFLLFILELWRNKKSPFNNIAFGILGVVYIAFPLSLVMYLFDPVNLSGPGHYGVVLGFFVILWLSDTGAYFVGSLIGKHKLFERISPGKTWEGSLGGTVFAMVTAWGLSLIFQNLDLSQWITLSIVIVISGTLGDLVESMLKRSINVKDSGTLLPGHGGILDRFDAVFISAPFVFVYLALFCK